MRGELSLKYVNKGGKESKSKDFSSFEDSSIPTSREMDRRKDWGILIDSWTRMRMFLKKQIDFCFQHWLNLAFFCFLFIFQSRSKWVISLIYRMQHMTQIIIVASLNCIAMNICSIGDLCHNKEIMYLINRLSLLITIGFRIICNLIVISLLICVYSLDEQ